MPLPASLLLLASLFCHWIFPLASNLTVSTSEAPGVNGNNPVNANPPSLVAVNADTLLGFPLRKYLFCHKMLPLPSSLTAQQSPVKVDIPLELVDPTAIQPPSGVAIPLKRKSSVALPKVLLQSTAPLLSSFVTKP